MEESVLWGCDQTYIKEATVSARNSFCFSKMNEFEVFEELNRITNSEG